MTEQDDRIIDGSGNVFADLGLPEPDKVPVNAELTHIIHTELLSRGTTPAEAAALFGIPERNAAQLLEGRFVPFSADRLLHFLTAMGRDVDIVVRPRRTDQPHARLRVLSPAA